MMTHGFNVLSVSSQVLCGSGTINYRGKTYMGKKVFDIKKGTKLGNQETKLEKEKNNQN